jgi:ribosome biogenesis protein BRX1
MANVMTGKRRARDQSDANDEKKVKTTESGSVSEGVSSKGYINKQRVLVFCSRGITTRYRHLMDDFRKLLPHHKKDVKVRWVNFDLYIIYLYN